MCYIPEIKCPYKIKTCLCQWCEKLCNNGFECSECDGEKKAVHNHYMCTGFVGTYPEGYTSDYIKQKAEELLKQKEEQ